MEINEIKINQLVAENKKLKTHLNKLQDRVPQVYLLEAIIKDIYLKNIEMYETNNITENGYYELKDYLEQSFKFKGFYE